VISAGRTESRPERLVVKLTTTSKTRAAAVRPNRRSRRRLAHLPNVPCADPRVERRIYTHTSRAGRGLSPAPYLVGSNIVIRGSLSDGLSLEPCRAARGATCVYLAPAFDHTPRALGDAGPIITCDEVIGQESGLIIFTPCVRSDFVYFHTLLAVGPLLLFGPHQHPNGPTSTGALQACRRGLPALPPWDREKTLGDGGNVLNAVPSTASASRGPPMDHNRSPSAPSGRQGSGFVDLCASGLPRGTSSACWRAANHGRPVPPARRGSSG
jgi:hypothetical protein